MAAVPRATVLLRLCLCPVLCWQNIPSLRFSSLDLAFWRRKVFLLVCFLFFFFHGSLGDGLLGFGKTEAWPLSVCTRVARLRPNAWLTVYPYQAPQLLQNCLAELGGVFSLCCPTSLMENRGIALQGSLAPAFSLNPLLCAIKLC